MKVINYIINAWKKLYAFFAQWNELITVPIIIILYIIVMPLIRMIDPTAGAYDGGYFLKPFVVVTHFLIYHAVVWLVIKVTFPSVFKYLEMTFERLVYDKGEFNGDVSEWRKVWVAVSLFFAYLFGLILVALSV